MRYYGTRLTQYKSQEITHDTHGTRSITHIIRRITHCIRRITYAVLRITHDIQRIDASPITHMPYAPSRITYDASRMTHHVRRITKDARGTGVGCHYEQLWCPLPDVHHTVPKRESLYTGRCTGGQGASPQPAWGMGFVAPLIRTAREIRLIA